MAQSTIVNRTSKYKHIFFDLDHTIWDFDKNAEETLHELYSTYKLKDIGLKSADLFIETYTRHNHRLWAQYHLGEITKDELREARFKSTFIELGVQPDLMPADFEDAYVMLGPTKTNLFPHAHETLAYLQGKYTLHLISNGFKESTEMKVAGTNLSPYFQNIIISEVVGVNKPDPAIFKHAIELAGATIPESVMIGDSIEADIRGAMGVGMDAIYFNPLQAEKPADVDMQIHHLKELTLLL
ncbi:YjjG family noncanonical pyrimidine nucleotidase [Mucilaginibacter phyllosphaerae]|uniref:Hydrolase of the HAD superfamily n=1 Tax=Mucilaginibacter phyllosphaerae TaxID=1812349 RepID=A0A4Y8ABC3_9SPHI|nr:YjjG family noncanonical pyrimidine nucleotidase [Mucilaginibacter phyllosphaerae]MBB3969847.1 putative hydrolase of the HAD superfamily [Mucilaginibacter phyllosphaerae]TEW65222.1 noncanonical pyrimidine nucleotidase, YjjG family [Mucilaginibacter phyllosphaerae]GGH17187.1 noncanonical pyrimidine nucleotidase, YjjG family protein [Mucilaginibacter phyllosphaerae]